MAVEYDTLYARLPEMLRERHAAGYATDEEVTRAIRTLIRSDAGEMFKHKSGWHNREELSSLTDEEFATLANVKHAAPAGAEVVAVCITDGGGDYRDSTEDDDPEDIDDDGEVYEPPINPRRVALVTWTRGGVEVKSTVPLAKQPSN